MGALLGPAGELLEIHCASAIREASGPRGVATTMMSGRVRYQYGPPPRRTWDLRLGAASPEQAATLAHRALRRGDLSRPWWWISEEAQTANLLTPQISMLEDGHRVGGDRVTPSATDFSSADNWHPLSVVSDSGLSTINLAREVPGTNEPLDLKADITTPIPHNQIFTASMYFTRPAGNADSSFRVQEVDQTGTVTRTHYALCRTDQALQRLHITATTLPVTVALRLQAFKARAIADPAVTLTDRPLPYAVGGGASRVALHEASHAVEMATPDLDGRRSAWNYQVVEVG